jgi:3'-phosphoadenosine 5'-phosphosulfate sulfotransferase (PAPS reductase)/FAD synthetase
MVAMTKTIHCFFSGGRDSALACYIAHRVAKQRGWDFRLVHIDTTIAIKQTREYVKQYAQWLGAEITIIKPEKTFREYAAQHCMWPSLQPREYRWCYYRLKLEPTTRYLDENYKEGDITVMGVRKGESMFRDKFYTQTFFTRDYGKGLKVNVWAPLLHVDSYILELLVKRFGIPRNPVWRIGFSGECLCLAGAPLHEIAIILHHFPEERDMLLDVDRVINKGCNRKSKRPSAPPDVYRAGFQTLEDFYVRVVKPQTTLDDFLPYTGKACQGSCML